MNPRGLKAETDDVTFCRWNTKLPHGTHTRVRRAAEKILYDPMTCALKDRNKHYLNKTIIALQARLPETQPMVPEDAPNYERCRIIKQLREKVQRYEAERKVTTNLEPITNDTTPVT